MHNRVKPSLKFERKVRQNFAAYEGKIKLDFTTSIAQFLLEVNIDISLRWRTGL